MREYSSTATVTVFDDASLADDVFDAADATPDRVCIRRRREDGSWYDVTRRQFADDVLSVAKGLVAKGIRPGDRVAIMSKTRYEWTVLDYALWSAAAVGVPVYETSSADQVEWILADAECVAVVVETAEHAGTVGRCRERLPRLRAVWTIDDGAVKELATAGAAVGDDEIHERRRAVGADDLATVIYTSGTTGRPKGCELSHRNLLFEVQTALAGMGSLISGAASTLVFLPIAHVLGRVIQCAVLTGGAQLGHTADVTNLIEDLQAFRPTFLLAVPRVFEKVHNSAKQRAYGQGAATARIFSAAERTAIAYSKALDGTAADRANESGAPRIPARIRLPHKLFNRLVYSKLRAALGGRCTAAISGGAPLGDRLGHFFRGIGVTVYEGYGLTETTAACCLNRPDAIRVGTVGRPLGGVSVGIGDDGEILLQGPVVFAAYHNNARATAEAFDGGWFHTGDLGELDDGYLRITGRKKEIIVTAGGKNVSPTILEDQLRSHPLISQCMVIGEGKPFIAALITVDGEGISTWRGSGAAGEDGRRSGPSQDDAALVAAIQQAVDAANQAVSRAESIRKFRILDADFTEQSGELTPKQSIRRAVVLDRYAAQIAEIYG